MTKSTITYEDQYGNELLIGYTRYPGEEGTYYTPSWPPEIEINYVKDINGNDVELSYSDIECVQDQIEDSIGEFGDSADLEYERLMDC